METEINRNSLLCSKHYQQECIYVDCDSEGPKERLLCRKCCQQKGSIDFPLIKDIVSRDMLYKEAYQITHDRKENQTRYYQNLNRTFDKLMHDIIWSVEKLKIQYVESSKWFFSHIDTFRCRKLLEEMDIRLYEISQHTSLQTSNVLYNYIELFKEYHKEKKLIEKKERGLANLVDEFEKEFKYFSEMIRSLQMTLEQKITKFISENEIPYFSMPRLASLSGFGAELQESGGKKYSVDDSDRMKDTLTTLDRTKKSAKDTIDRSHDLNDRAQTLGQSSIKKIQEENIISPSPKKADLRLEDSRHSIEGLNLKERPSATSEFSRTPPKTQQKSPKNDDYLHMLESALGMKQSQQTAPQEDIQSARTMKPKTKYSLAKLLTLTTEPQTDITPSNFRMFIETYNKCFHEQGINIFGTKDTAAICNAAFADSSDAKSIALRMYEAINLRDDVFNLDENHFLNFQFFVHEIENNFKILFAVRYLPDRTKWEVLSFDWKETKDRQIEVDSEIERNKFQQGFQSVTSVSIYEEGKSEKLKAPFSKKKIMLKSDFDLKGLNCKVLLFLIRVYAEQYEAVEDMRTINMTKEMVNQIYQEKFKPNFQE